MADIWIRLSQYTGTAGQTVIIANVDRNNSSSSRMKTFTVYSGDHQPITLTISQNGATQITYYTLLNLGMPLRVFLSTSNSALVETPAPEEIHISGIMAQDNRGNTHYGAATILQGETAGTINWNEGIPEDTLVNATASNPGEGVAAFVALNW